MLVIGLGSTTNSYILYEPWLTTHGSWLWVITRVVNGTSRVNPLTKWDEPPSTIIFLIDSRQSNNLLNTNLLGCFNQAIRKVFNVGPKPQPIAAS